MTNEEKQNNIVEEYNRKTHSSGYQSELYESLQEYGEWVKQQTLEEAIESVPEKTSRNYDGNRLETACREYGISAKTWSEIIRYEDGHNSCRQQTLSNLQALKDKNI